MDPLETDERAAIRAFLQRCEVRLSTVHRVATALLGLPFAALWLVLRDLTLFYFHAQHVAHDGHDVFTPRFTLTGSDCLPTSWVHRRVTS